jgi:precorrin-3B synthase
VPAAGRGPDARPAARGDRDGCPGALRLHAAADGPLARVRLPGGTLTGGQLAALADMAARWGDGHLELTSRGNLQLRALTGTGAADLAARLRAAGLFPSDTHETVRNIVASPLSGRDGRGLLDVRPLVPRLDAAVCARPGLAELPGRFLLALDDGRGDVAAPADVAAVGIAPHLVEILVAGADIGLRVPADEAVTTLCAAA